MAPADPCGLHPNAIDFCSHVRSLSLKPVTLLFDCVETSHGFIVLGNSAVEQLELCISTSADYVEEKLRTDCSFNVS